MNILPFRGLLPDLNAITKKDHFFQTVKEDYNLFLHQHYFRAPGAPAFYVLRMQQSTQIATGLICTTHIQDYFEGKVLRHEKTIHDKELVQIRLLEERQAAVKPVLLVHRYQEEIHQWLQEYAFSHPPTLTVKLNGDETHTLWEVSRASDIEQVQRLYRNELSTVAIADGHHRFSCFATLWQQQATANKSLFSSVLTAYFPQDELKIQAFHRLIELPDEGQRKTLMQQLKHLGTLRAIQAPKRPDRKHQMSVISAGSWFNFDWDPALLSPATDQNPQLDVELLHRHIMVPLLQVEDIQKDQRVHYLEGTDQPGHLEQVLTTYPPGVCFVLYPITPEDFLRVASLGLTLVPKATFFLPRLQNGMVVLSLI